MLVRRRQHIVQRADRIDPQRFLTAWLIDASLAALRETLTLQRPVAARHGVSIAIELTAPSDSPGWYELRRSIIRECIEDQDVTVDVTGLQSLTLTLNTDHTTDVDDGYVLIS